MAIQWRPEINALTTPPSYRIRFVPTKIAGRKEIAADIALRHPNFSQDDILTILNSEDDVVALRLLNGEQVTKEGCCSWFPSFTGRLNSPDDPLPPLEECLQVNVRVSPIYVEGLRKNGETLRLALEKKLPVITSVTDSLLELKDVLNPNGALQLNGTDLYFDRKQAGAGECVIEGTASGRKVQTRFLKVEKSEIIFMPDIPSQTHPWNNAYKVSVSTRYSEHGTLRTGTYEWPLRTPLVIPTLDPGQATGILSGAADVPYVQVVGGTASADETLRIQVILDLQADCLRFNLLDMTEGGIAGAAIAVTTNGDITLQGFADSAITTLDIRILEYAALKDMLRNEYNCRLVDVLIVQ
jgi:hypothetical protein